VLDVRRLGPEDEALAVELGQAFYGAEGINVVFLEDDRNYLLAGYADGALAGFLVAYELERLERKEVMTYLHRLDVLPDYQRRGVGRALVEELKTLAQKRGSYKMFVITGRDNESATALYEATGGRIIPGADAVYEYRQGDQKDDSDAKNSPD
jgi:ribosomal protein S18 acetylase RimI-like enzyme